MACCAACTCSLCVACASKICVDIGTKNRLTASLATTTAAAFQAVPARQGHPLAQSGCRSTLRMIVPRARRGYTWEASNGCRPPCSFLLKALYLECLLKALYLEMGKTLLMGHFCRLLRGARAPVRYPPAARRPHAARRPRGTARPAPLLQPILEKPQLGASRSSSTKVVPVAPTWRAPAQVRVC